MLPNFLVIGAGRSGTTWIYECLKEHPDVFVPKRIKELNFFNRHSNYERGVEWYEKFFKDHSGQKAIGEVTPTYLCCPEVPARIYKHFPRMRLIVSLRNPVERAYSSYIGYVLSGIVRRGVNILDASKKLVFDNQSSIVDHGFYFEHISRFLKYFSKEQMCILLFDDLLDNPRLFIKTVYDFLMVDSSFIPSYIDKKVNSAKYSEALRKMNMVINCFGNMHPKLKKTADILTRRARDLLVRNGYPAIDDNVRIRLNGIYKEDRERLSNLLNKDLTKWR